MQERNKKKTKAKKTLILLSVLCLMFSFCACGNEQMVTDEDGNILEYEDYEIPETGFYVYNSETKLFSPVMSGASGYDGLANPDDEYSDGGLGSFGSEEELQRYVWVSDKEYNPEKLIPEVDGKKTKLVYYNTSSEDMPEEYIIEKYAKVGYTLGVHITFGDTGNKLYLDNKECCESSDAEEILDKSTSGNLLINKINNSAKLPVNNIDQEINILTGLEKDKKYQVGYFDGTQYEDVDIIADTLVFKAQSATSLESPFKPTENSYFIVNLPKNLKNGYYYMNENGMFKYTGNN